MGPVGIEQRAISQTAFHGLMFMKLFCYHQMLEKAFLRAQSAAQPKADDAMLKAPAMNPSGTLVTFFLASLSAMCFRMVWTEAASGRLSGSHSMVSQMTWLRSSSRPCSSAITLRTQPRLWTNAGWQSLNLIAIHLRNHGFSSHAQGYQLFDG